MEEEVKKKKKLSPWKIVLICVGGFLAFVLTVAGGFLIFAAATELKPDAYNHLCVTGTHSKTLATTDTVSLLSWNTGYSTLDENADFFLDGGTQVRASSQSAVIKNMDEMSEEINTLNPDIVFLQEVDSNSDRSRRYNEVTGFRNNLGLDKYQSSYALNYKAGYVPYPFPKTLGKVESGLVSFSKYEVKDAQRIQLPIPFSWPLSMINLKRCLLVSRVGFTDSSKELVLINLHLEAYDDGEGKAKQTNMLKEFIQSEYEKGNYVIASGDFNQTFSNVDLTNYPTYGNNWKSPIIDVNEFSHVSCIMDNTHPTCRLLDKPYKNADKSTFQYYMIDGMIVTDNIHVNSVETKNLNFKNSDHNPVLMEFSFN